MSFFPHANPASTARLPASALRPPSSHLPTFAPSQIRNPESKIQNLPSPLHLHLSPNPHPLRASRGAAFSLTEVVIALGVATIAFTSIIALFPLGLHMSKESYEETQAALLAQAIIADLSDQVSSTSGKLIQKTGTNAMDAANYETIYMTADSEGNDRYIYLAYDQQIRTDSSNNPIMLRPCASSVSTNGPNEPSWFETNAPSGAILLVKISLKPFRMSPTGNPQRVDVTIESPANAPATNRIQYVFSGVIPQA